MKVKNEMRRAPRYVLKEGPVLGYVKDDETGSFVVTGTVYDISTTGVGIFANRYCKPESQISVQFCSLRKAPVFKTPGKVVRCFKKDEEQYLLGIEFDNIGDKLSSDVENYIKLIKSSQPALTRSLQ
jgi:c-di-GMP-binding flagellar brake protein YcgR